MATCGLFSQLAAGHGVLRSSDKLQLHFESFIYSYFFLTLPTGVAVAVSALISLASLWCSSALAVELTSLVNPALASSPAGYATVIPSFFKRGDCSTGLF